MGGRLTHLLPSCALTSTKLGECVRRVWLRVSPLNITCLNCSLDCEGRMCQVIGAAGSGKKEYIRTHEKNTVSCIVVLCSCADGSKPGNCPIVSADAFSLVSDSTPYLSSVVRQQ